MGDARWNYDVQNVADELDERLDALVQEAAIVLRERASATLKPLFEEPNTDVRFFKEAKKELIETVARLATKKPKLMKKSAAIKATEQQISESRKGSDDAAAQIKTLTARVAELEKALAEEQKRAAEPEKEDEEVVVLNKSDYLKAARLAAYNLEELTALRQENAELRKELTRKPKVNPQSVIDLFQTMANNAAVLTRTVEGHLEAVAMARDRADYPNDKLPAGVEFTIDPPNCDISAARETSAHKIVNHTNRILAFKIKSPNSPLYTVNITHGVINGGSCIYLFVTRAEGKCKKDKFVIEYASIDKDCPDPLSPFKSDKIEGEITGEVVLKVTAAK